MCRPRRSGCLRLRGRRRRRRCRRRPAGARPDRPEAQDVAVTGLARLPLRPTRLLLLCHEPRRLPLRPTRLLPLCRGPRLLWRWWRWRRWPACLVRVTPGGRRRRGRWRRRPWGRHRVRLTRWDAPPFRRTARVVGFPRPVPSGVTCRRCRRHRGRRRGESAEQRRWIDDPVAPLPLPAVRPRALQAKKSVVQEHDVGVREQRLSRRRAFSHAPGAVATLLTAIGRIALERSAT